MGQHFQGKYEVELKFRLNESCSKQQLLERLNAMEHECMFADNQEDDCYFDTPDGQLDAADKSLCIREMQPSNNLLWILKGPGTDCCEAVNISDAARARSMLSAMGYVPVQRLQKRRSIYFIGKWHMTLDSLAGLGDFAELAIMTDDSDKLEQLRSELWQLAARFGLTQAMLESRSYRQLCRTIPY